MLLNGTVDQLVHENGGLASHLPFAELKPMSLIDAKAQASEFSALIYPALTSDHEGKAADFSRRSLEVLKRIRRVAYCAVDKADRIVARKFSNGPKFSRITPLRGRSRSRITDTTSVTSNAKTTAVNT